MLLSVCDPNAHTIASVSLQFCSTTLTRVGAISPNRDMMDSFNATKVRSTRGCLCFRVYTSRRAKRSEVYHVLHHVTTAHTSAMKTSWSEILHCAHENRKSHLHAHLHAHIHACTTRPGCATCMEFWDVDAPAVAGGQTARNVRTRRTHMHANPHTHTHTHTRPGGRG